MARLTGRAATNPNPFAIIVLAHLKARQTRDNPEDRHSWKIHLVRGLYEGGFSAEDVRDLFRLIDWMMVLPPMLEQVFSHELDQIQKEKQMPFVTSIERVALQKGIRMGIKSLLKSKFGEAGLNLMPEINVIYDEKKLEEILNGLETATSLDEVRRLWTSSGS
jgi:hypothetical protein